MEIIIIESTQVNYGDDRGGVHEDSGNIVDVPKDQARKLTEANRALYTKKADDPFKDGRFTATEEMLKTARAMAKAKQKAAVKLPPNTQTGDGAGTGGEGQ